MKNSKIPWTHHTFNPWIGCKQIAEGCKNCYAKTLNNRFKWVPEWNGLRERTSDQYWKQPLTWNRKAEKTGEQIRVFAGSMCDVFDKSVPDKWRSDFFNLIEKTPNLTWLLLTKRHEQIWYSIPGTWVGDNFPENIWMGASASNQIEFDSIIKVFEEIPIGFSVKFISIEPLIEPISIENGKGVLDWVIVGGETGASARPMKMEWIDSIYRQCKRLGIPYYYKQMGSWFDKNYTLLDKRLETRQFPKINQEDVTCLI